MWRGGHTWGSGQSSAGTGEKECEKGRELLNARRKQLSGMPVWETGSDIVACKTVNPGDSTSARWHQLQRLRVEEALCSPEPTHSAKLGLREHRACLALGTGTGAKGGNGGRAVTCLSFWSCPELGLVPKILSQPKKGLESKEMREDLSDSQ